MDSRCKMCVPQNGLKKNGTLHAKSKLSKIYPLLQRDRNKSLTYSIEQLNRVIAQTAMKGLGTESKESIFTKLNISQPGDKYEKEADRIADTVMNMPQEEEKESIQTKSIIASLMIQRQGITTPTACHGTNRIGNLNYPGTPEHIVIQQYYISVINPIAEIEYHIPNSGRSGGPGYADIVDPFTGGIYEIKFYPFATSAIAEVAQYVAMARIHCDPFISWHPGLIYPPATIPFVGNTEIVSWLIAPGVIAYYVRNKQPQPLRRPVRERVPVPVGRPVLEKISEFIRRTAQSGEDAYNAAREFLKQNPDVVRYFSYIAAGALIAAAVVIIVGTILEDIASFGGGIADDPASIAVAWALGRAAFQMIK